MNQFVKSVLLKFQVFQDLREGRGLRQSRERPGSFPIYLEYEVHSTPRYGYNKPPHPELFEILNASRGKYAEILRQFLQFENCVQTIPINKPEDPDMPYWHNGALQALDPLSLYAFVSLNNPRLYIEIGSGNSTKFVRKAIEDRHLQTRIISIDPYPRPDTHRVCDQLLREPLEETDLTVFDTLASGDILFVDGSHRVFMNSDVTVVFLEILPRLKPGVLVYIDDIFLPLDYPPEWIPRYFSEQYLLAVLLLSKENRYEVVLPCTFVANDPELMKILDPLWEKKSILENVGPGNGFWLRVR